MKKDIQQTEKEKTLKECASKEKQIKEISIGRRDKISHVSVAAMNL